MTVLDKRAKATDLMKRGYTPMSKLFFPREAEGAINLNKKIGIRSLANPTEQGKYRMFIHKGDLMKIGVDGLEEHKKEIAANPEKRLIKDFAPYNPEGEIRRRLGEKGVKAYRARKRR